MVTSLSRDTRIRIPKKIGTGSGTLPTQKSGCATGLRYIPEKYRHKKKRPPNGDLSSSGYQDSNLGPPAPKAGALPGCATSRNVIGLLVIGIMMVVNK
jgi:hypothetical protein